MALKDRVLIKFPTLVTAAEGIGLTIANGVYNFFLKFMDIDEIDSVADLSTRYIILTSVDNDGNELHERIPLDKFASTSSGKVQEITAGGTQNIDVDAAVVLVNQDVAAPITLQLPDATLKIGKMKIVDWKGDAATNNITLMPFGSQKFQGNIASWKITGNKASVVLDPVPGIGYAV